jgi:putative ABC transport system permease protein
MRNHRKPAPPKAANWLVSRFVSHRYLEEFFGDLEEIYEERILTKGKFLAWLMYWADAFHLLVGFSSSGISKHKNSSGMIRSMFKIAWRSAVRQKQFSILNVIGLTIGIATSLIIGLYVYDETTYDTFHSKGDRIYRINQPMIWNNWDEQFASTGPNVAEALREDAPELEQVTRMLSVGEQNVRVRSGKEKITLFTEEQHFGAEENFFKVFSFEFLNGDPATALKDPMSMIITLKTARRYFGYEDAMGKIVEVKEKDGSWTAYTIRGVLADIPTRSHLQFDILVSLASFPQMKTENWKWIWTGFSTYGLVKEGTHIPALTNKIQALPPKWAAATTERIFNQTFNEFTAGKQWRLYLQPLKEIYLAETPGHHRFGPSGNPQFVAIFSGIGILVLVLSSINFMNLSTARSSNRTKEVGVRKVLGSQRNMLIKQFIVESLLYVAVSTVCAFLLVQLSLSGFNIVAEKQLALLPHFANPFFLGTIVLFMAVLGVTAGSYPAFYLSSFKPIETLKGKISTGFKRKGIRNVLVVFQFTVSIALIICTFFVQKQLTYTSTMDVGFAKDNVLQIHNIEQLGTDGEVLKTRFEANPAFTHVGKSFGIPPYVWEGERYRAFVSERPATDNPVADITNLRADGNYLTLLGIEFLVGRNFDMDRVNDKYGIILNEEAVRILGWGTKETYATDSPIGKFVIQAFDQEKKLEVIGVVKNFNFNSVRQKIDPLMIIHYQNDWFWNFGQGRSYISMRLNPASVKNAKDLQSVIDKVKADMIKMDGSVPFEYSFMDQEFENTFRSEQRMGTVLSLFTFLAVIIASLGLYGLSAFSAEQRTKELGIRKVLGAKVYELMFLFSSEFTKLILLAIILASPAAYFMVDYWLSNFAYRTSIDLWVFIIAALSALMIALLTISYQSFSAARINPVETLKNE